MPDPETPIPSKLPDQPAPPIVPDPQPVPYPLSPIVSDPQPIIPDSSLVDTSSQNSSPKKLNPRLSGIRWGKAVES